jgi:tetratricopeptide (TPR) repeat protein
MQANPQNMDPAKNALERIPEKKAIDGLKEIKIPVLIIVGEYDIPDVFAHAGAIEAGVENGRREVIRDAGHLVPFEQPEAFNRQVSMFLNGAAFFQALNSEGVAAAVALFNKNRLEDPSWIPFSEIEMNILGYQHLQAGKIKEAIELFKLNVAAYPGSANTYDSLGEAYMNNGDKAPAIRNYKKSLELDPKNTNAIEMLKKLEQDL